MVGINMEMPNNCYDCYRNMYCIVGIDGGWRPDRRVEDCPLVEIDTCKDCKHYDPLTCNSGTCLNPNMQWSNEVSATHYCTDYEKRGGEND